VCLFVWSLTFFLSRYFFFLQQLLPLGFPYTDCSCSSCPLEFPRPITQK
jgi:hypothetical protein